MKGGGGREGENGETEEDELEEEEGRETTSEDLRLGLCCSCSLSYRDRRSCCRQEQ